MLEKVLVLILNVVLNNGKFMKNIYDAPLRDQYAGQAMAALIQSNFSPNPWEIARQSFEIAEAMIEIKRESHDLQKAEKDYEVFSQS